MRRIVVHMMMSLDGFVAPADGDESWMVAPDPERDAASLATVNAVDAGMAGHGVYRDMVGYWPTAQGETDDQRAYIERVNAMPKLIVARSAQALEWNNASTFVIAEHTDLPAKIDELKRTAGGDIVLWGGAELVREFAAHDLIDEYQLIVQPVALGAGQGLFADLDRWQSLQLLEVRGFATGAVFVRYAPAHNDTRS